MIYKSLHRKIKIQKHEPHKTWLGARINNLINIELNS